MILLSTQILNMDVIILPEYSKQTLLHESLEHMPNPHICLLQIGWEKCKPEHSYTNYRDMYLIHIIKRGKGTLQINNKQYSLEANNMFLICPNQLAIYTADSEDPWEYYYFAFNGAFSAELLERSVFRKNHFIQKNCNDELISKIIEASYAIREAKNPDLIGLEYLFKFLTLMSYNEKKTGRKENLHLKYVVPIQQYIEQHYSEPLVTSEFAKMLNIDRTYFYKIFKEYTGLSPEKYIISLRIQRAKLLISATDLPLSTIGNLVGYENYPPFFSMFKKIVGISPNEYRTQINNFPKTYDNGLFESNLE